MSRDKDRPSLLGHTVYLWAISLRWVVGLSGYAFDIVFRDSAGNATADFFTRFAIQPQADDDLDSDEHFVCATMTNGLPVKSAAEIASEGTKKDSMLVKVYKINILSLAGRVVVRGQLGFKPVWNRRDDISLENGCLLWGRRVIVPFTFQ